MAKAYICDRCKQFYTVSNAYLGKYVVGLDDGGFGPKKFDLCSDCSIKLAEFMQEYEETEK